MDPVPCLGQRQKKKLAKAAVLGETSRVTNCADTNVLDGATASEKTYIGCHSGERTHGGSSKYSNEKSTETNHAEAKVLDEAIGFEKTDVERSCDRATHVDNNAWFTDPQFEDAGPSVPGTSIAQAMPGNSVFLDE